MDREVKAVLTALVVLIVMAAVRWGGRRVGGVAAALPTITAPTLVWLAHESGVGVAVDAAIGSIAACAMLAAFALCYAWAARIVGPWSALSAGVAGAALLAWPARWASGRLVDALALACIVCTIAVAAMPRLQKPAGGRPASLLSMVVAATVAATTSTIAASIGPSVGGFASGLVSSLPWITGAVAMAEHGTGGHHAVGTFLAGYAGGLFAKAMFGCVFAVLAPLLGTALALIAGCVCVALVSSLQRRPGAWAAATASSS